jgi:hypothetical protein
MSTTVFLLQLWAVLWIRYDAQELGVFKGRLGGGMFDMSVRSWVLCSLILPIITLPCYVLGARPKHIGLEWLAVASLVPDSAAEKGVPVVAPAAGEWHAAGGWAAAQDPQPAVHVPAQAEVAAPTAPPQRSPDGYWWWDGTQWTPAADMAVSRG